MGEDVIQRLFDKIDALKEQIAELNTKIVKIETQLEEQKNNKTDVTKAFAWLVTTAIAVYAAFFRGGNA